MATILKRIPLKSIIGSVYQPRLQEDRQLRPLAACIRVNGLRTPPAVLKDDKKKETYHMVSGHRRRAALLLLLKQGVKSLPSGHASITKGQVYVDVLIGNVSRKEAAFHGFIENINRKNLSPYEQAVTYKVFTEQLGYTRAEIIKRAQKSKQEVHYMISSLDPQNVPIKMIQSWQKEQLEKGHMKVLYRLRGNRTGQKQLYQKILKEKLSVRQAEFWYTQLAEKPDLPLENREFNVIKKRFLANAELKQLIDEKKLHLDQARDAQTVEIKASGVSDLRKVCELMVAALEGVPL